MTASFALPRHLLTITLAGLAIFLVLVPLALYSFFAWARQDRQDILIRSIEAEGRIIAAAIAPMLAGEDSITFAGAAREVSRFSDPGARVRLLFRPSGSLNADDFRIVGGTPALDGAGLQRERAMLFRQGVIADVSRACAGEETALRPYKDSTAQDFGAANGSLSAIYPVSSGAGCWAVLLTYPAQKPMLANLNQPLWQRPEVQEAAVIYFIFTALTLAVFMALRNSLLRFGRVARAVSQGAPSEQSFLEHNQITELDEVATEMDDLVASLKRSTDRIRQRAEDNAHALKTPVAIMRQSLVPLQRELAAASDRTKRALDLMTQTVDRLDSLVDDARQIEDSAAELVDPPRRRVDLSRMLRQMLRGYGPLAEGRGIELEADLPPGLAVAGSEKLISSALESVLDDLIIASPPGRRIEIQVLRNSLRTEIAVAGSASGIPTEQRNRIFASTADGARKPLRTPEGSQTGLGLRTARDKLEAMGGGIHIENGPGNGLLIFLDLPVVDAPPTGRQLRRRLVLGLQAREVGEAGASA